MKIKEDAAFFGVIMTKTSQRDSIFLLIIQDRNNVIKVQLRGIAKELPVGSPIYGRGKEALAKDGMDLLIDLSTESHRFISVNAKYLERNSKLNPADDFSNAELSDGKPIYGFENFERLDFNELRKTFNLFRVVRTELNGENRTKIAEGKVPRYIFGEAIKLYFENFKVSFLRFSVLKSIFRLLTVKNESLPVSGNTKDRNRKLLLDELI